MVIHRIDLVPTGSIFSMDAPRLEGDTYVFRILPEKTVERLPRARVKAITRRTRDFAKEVVYQVELKPSGTILVGKKPVKKGLSYVISTWKNGTLLSVKKADIRKINRLTGMAAFKAEEIELGVVSIATGPTPGGGAPRAASPGTSSAPPPGTAPASGNWVYQGVPGQTDAYAPANATISHPGGVPRAPEPTPNPK
jgi:hypothetical protein